MKVLFAAAEIHPYAKSGGLADVSQSLPNALSAAVEITAVMPLYGSIDPAHHAIRATDLHFDVSVGDSRHPVRIHEAQNDGVATLFVDAPGFGDRHGLYGDATGEYPDNDLRFGIFCAAVVELAQRFGSDVLHLNDWHTAPAALWAREKRLKARVIYTIHNLAYQGVFEAQSLQRLGWSRDYFTMDMLEFYGRVNWMKAGIAFSDRVTTVSPAYAQEILTPEFGCGLDGFLSGYRHKLSGIVNGIDTGHFDPERDPSLFCNYGPDDPEGKKKNKHALVQSYAYKDPERPLLIMVTRLVHQKGIDLVLEAIEMLLALPVNLLMLGEGDEHYRLQLEGASARHENFVILFGYDEALSHRIYAAGDILLMPSLFEPCGLNQLIAMHYGTLPVVHCVGGLKDTVHDVDIADKEACGRGIVFETAKPEALTHAVKRALALLENPERFAQVMRRNMECDFSFKSSAERYLELYRSELEPKDGSSRVKRK